MPTLVLPPRLNDDCKTICEVAINEGWQTFESPGWHIAPVIALDDPVIYSEPLFADVAAAELSVHLLDPPVDWLASAPYDYVRRTIRFGKLHDVRTSLSGAWFLKPAEDKSFATRVYDAPSELPDASLFLEEIPVLVSEPVEWQLEVRCFVLDRRVRALSPYFRSGELATVAEGQWPFFRDEEAEAREFAERVLADSRLTFPPSVVLDIGFIMGRGWAIVELNPAWGSGIYGCNPQEVLPVLRRSTISSQQAVSAEDQRFLRTRVSIERY